MPARGHQLLAGVQHLVCCVCWNMPSSRMIVCCVAGTTTNAEAYKQWELQKRAQVSNTEPTAMRIQNFLSPCSLPACHVADAADNAHRLQSQHLFHTAVPRIHMHARMHICVRKRLNDSTTELSLAALSTPATCSCACRHPQMCQHPVHHLRARARLTISMARSRCRSAHAQSHPPSPYPCPLKVCRSILRTTGCYVMACHADW